jgi:hypothetical protein
MKVQFLRIISSGSRSTGRYRPEVTAFADGRFKVTWRPRQGWACRDCDNPDAEWCAHVDAVAALLSPIVVGGKA